MLGKKPKLCFDLFQNRPNFSVGNVTFLNGKKSFPQAGSLSKAEKIKTGGHVVSFSP